jgi:hypothetical protein
VGVIAIEINEDLFNIANNISRKQNRSIQKQIEHWIRIGKIAEDNPELSYNVISDILIGISQIQQNKIEPYVFGEGD